MLYIPHVSGQFRGRFICNINAILTVALCLKKDSKVKGSKINLANLQ